MAQGKMKVKGKVPEGSKKKNKSAKKGAVSKRNRPVAPKKAKFEEASKLKKIITKTVNKAMEDEIRGRASEGAKNLSKAQQAVAKHHEKQALKKKK